ncbi:unnamed protein product, partial [Urochloa humidicola]
DLEWRQAQLRGLVRLLEEKEEDIFDVLREDLGKHRAEAFRDEVGVLKKSVVDKLQNHCRAVSTAAQPANRRTRSIPGPGSQTRGGTHDASLRCRQGTRCPHARSESGI